MQPKGENKMLKPEQMKERANEYELYFYESAKEVYISHNGDEYVKIKPQRAKLWVEAGIQDLDCRTKQEMLDLLNSWL